MRRPVELMGTVAAQPPLGHPCDGCADAFVPMSGPDGWLLIRIELTCPDCDEVSARYLHLCRTCAVDPVASLNLVKIEPPSTQPARAPHLRLVEGSGG